MTDFSEAACKFQEGLITTLVSNFAKQKKSEKSLFETNNNSLTIAKQDARSMSQPDNSIDLIIDKVIKKNIQTNSKSKVFCMKKVT